MNGIFLFANRSLTLHSVQFEHLLESSNTLLHAMCSPTPTGNAIALLAAKDAENLRIFTCKWSVTVCQVLINLIIINNI